MRKPYWLNKHLDLSLCRDIKQLLRKNALNSVCEESLCPNITECFAKGVATFLIMGSSCTRRCRFCSVDKSFPLPLDLNEPERVSLAVSDLNLKYVVITSPTRDDLADGGAAHFFNTVSWIKRQSKSVLVELLVPDFKGDAKALETVVCSGCDVLSHNLETVPQLYSVLRPGAEYQRSLTLLKKAKQIEKIPTKSGFMVGFGESQDQVYRLLEDLSRVKCDFLTIGQYLPPSRGHYPLKEYVGPDIFNKYREYALSLGFLDVKSSPYVRSSYRADDLAEKIVKT
ncbi:MAG: lipoyl synthase [Candidatus Omnitrophica bacterium]|nr:lipoyl synthase [Candidatus Omnitrophota bacterium]